MSEPTAEGVIFDPVVRLPRLADTIAERLLDAIVAGQLREGDILPSERELGTQFGVSRTVIREAIRSLATRGIVEVRSGRGVRVVSLDSRPVTEAMSLLLRRTPGINFPKVHEARTMLETHIAGVAAERATPDDVVQLGELVQRAADAADDIDLASQLDVDFHRAIAQSTQNELYVVLLDSIGPVLLEYRKATLALPHRPAEVVEDHQRVLAGIEQHDPVAARRAMEQHLGHVTSAWQDRLDGRGEPKL